MDSAFGTFAERTGVLADFYDEKIKEVARKMVKAEDPFMVVKDTYPRIYKMIVDLWGTDLLHLRLAKMIALDTEGREGFDKPVGLALMTIYDKHMSEFDFEPIWHIPEMKRDIW